MYNTACTYLHIVEFIVIIYGRSILSAQFVGGTLQYS